MRRLPESLTAAYVAQMGLFPAPGQWTYDDYARLPDDGWRYKAIQGELYMGAAPRPAHQRVIRRMILVTGAAGKTGKAVIHALAQANQAVRAWLHRPEQTEGLPIADSIVGDLEDPRLWPAACSGVDALYLICPNMHPRELKIGKLALQSAQAAGISLFVYHSVLHPQTEEMPHHWQKLRVEEEILRSDLPFTILQPCAYMQNILAYRTQIAASGRYAVPYTIYARFGLVDLADVAQVAARVLSESDHAGAIYELAGPANLSSAEVAQALSSHWQRPIQAIQAPLDEWERSARATGMPSNAIRSLGAMFRYYDRYGLLGNGNVLSWLLGRRPTSFAQFVEREFSGCGGAALV